jgi:hypothetical protein
MALTRHLYLLMSTLLVAGGLTMVGLSTRAYLRTERPALIRLTIGFTLVVGATLSTTISAFLTGFARPETLLLVNSSFNAAGYGFLVYSLLTYE